MFGFLLLLFAPTLPRLAAHWLRYFERLGEPATFDEESATIVVEGGKRVALLNTLADLRAASIMHRWRLLRRQELALGSPPDLPTTLEDVMPRLFPRVNDRMFYESVRVTVGDAEIPYAPLAPHLGVGLVIDLPHSVAHVTSAMLGEWGRSLEDLLPVARANLLAHTHDDHFEEVAPGVLRSAHRDDFDDARLLLAPMLNRLPLAGDKLVCAVNRNALFVSATGIPDGLERLLAATEDALRDESRPTNGRIYRLDGFDLVEVEDESSPALRRRRIGADARDHEEQKALLDRRFESDGTELFVASLKVYGRPDGAWVSITTWTDGCDTLLPEADDVALVSDIEAEQPTVVVVPWKALVARCGALLGRTEHYPARYRTLGFPSSDDAAAMRSDVDSGR